MHDAIRSNAPRLVQWVLGAIVACCGLTSAAAQTTLSIEAGWEDQIRPGRWSPIFITVSDPNPRNVILELYAPHDRHTASRVRQHVVAQPSPDTYILYAPLSYTLEETRVTVRNSQPPHRRLNESFLEDQDFRFSNPSSSGRFVRTGEIFIGITGHRGTLRLLQGQFAQALVRTGYLPPRRLPPAAIGYDALDLLLLNHPDLAGGGQEAISLDQQRAIIDWVRAGGVLLIIPGAEPVPTNGPIADLLPADIGASIEISIPDKVRESVGLPDRFAQLTARRMVPHEDAETLQLIPDSNAVAFLRQYGLGHLVLLSFDASTLMFEEIENANMFWRPLLTRFAEMPDATQDQPYYQPFSTEDQRKINAVQHTMDLVGNVPGVGQFRFSYIAIVLAGLMFLVGPVDWFILKWLGRQPWTWATTIGWIGLVTTGAVALGGMMRSGDLHYRSVQIIDQADGMTVAETDFIGIYSPQSRTYRLEAPEGWWRPPTADGYWSSGGMRTELPFYQDIETNRPQDLRINIWTLRFLESDHFHRAPPMIDAQLAIDGDRLTGQITNLAEHPLEDLIVRTRDGNYRIGGSPIAPRQTLDISADLDRNLAFDASPHPHSYRPWGAEYQTDSLIERPQYAYVSDLAIRRSYSIERLLQHQDLAVIYARTDSAPPSAHLDAVGAVEQHWQIIRALVPLSRE